MTDISQARRIAVQPGDIFVLEVDASTTAQAVQRMREQWRQAVGDVPLLVTPGRLTCYRPVEPEGDPHDPSPDPLRP